MARLRVEPPSSHRWAILFVLLIHSFAWAEPLDFANGLYRQKRYQLAAEEYAAFLQAQPEGPDSLSARFYLAECHVQLKRDDLARPLFDEVVQATQTGPAQKSEQRAVAVFRGGELAFNARQFQEAARRLEAFRSEFRSHELVAHASYMLAESLRETGDIAAASKVLGEIDANAAPAPMQPYLKFAGAKLARRTGRLQDAAAVLGELSKNAADALADDALLELGLVGQDSRDHAAALAAFDELIQRHPNSTLVSPARLYRAISLEKLSRTEDARVELTKLLEDAKVDASLRAESAYRLAVALHASKDYAAAVAVLEKARREFADQPLAITLLFQEALTRSKDPKQSAPSRQLFEQFVREHKDHALAPQALYHLIRAGIEGGDRQLVDASWDGLRAGYPEDAWCEQGRIVMAEAILADRFPASTSTGDAARSKGAAILELASASRRPRAAARLRLYAATALFREADFKQVVEALKGLDASVADEEVARDAHYLNGIAHARLEHHAEAAEALERYLATSAQTPQTGTAYSTYAVALAHLPTTPMMESKWRALFEGASQGTEGPKRLLGVAHQLYGARQFAPSLEAYRRALAVSVSAEDKSAAALGAGWCQYEQGDKSAASIHFREAAAVAPPGSETLAESLLMSGVTASESNDVAAAISFFKRVTDELRDSKSYPEAASRLARLHAKAGQFAEADQVYAGLESAKDPAIRIKATLERAWLALERKDSAAAEQLFRAVADSREGGTSAVEAILKLAEIAHHSGNYQAALDRLSKADSFPTTGALAPALLYRKGLARKELNQADEARQSFQSLLAKYPESEWASASLFWLGELEFDRRQFDESIKIFGQLTSSEKAGKYRGLAQLRIAQAYFEKKDYSQAESHASVLDGSEDAELRAEATYLKARIRQQNAQFDEARELYRGIITDKRTETAAKAQFMIGETYLFQEQFDQAIKELLKVHILYAHPTWQSYALLEVGKCQEKKGEVEGSRETYQLLLSQFPKEPAAAQAKSRLDNLGSSGAKGS